MIDKQVTDILSLAILVILIGFSLFSGVSSLVQMDKEIQQYDVTYEDKTSTVKYTPSTKTYGSKRFSPKSFSYKRIALCIVFPQRKRYKVHKIVFLFTSCSAFLPG